MHFYEYENDFIMLATSKTKQELEAAELLKMKSKKTKNKLGVPETKVYKTPFAIKRRRYMANASRVKSETELHQFYIDMRVNYFIKEQARTEGGLTAKQELRIRRWMYRQLLSQEALF